MVKQRVDLVTSWEATEKKFEAWGVFYHVFLGDAAVHPATYEVCRLIEETAYIRARLQSQTQRQPTFSVALLRLLQTEFNESFHQALERRQRVRWPDFERLRRDFITGNFRPESINLQGLSNPNSRYHGAHQWGQGR